MDTIITNLNSVGQAFVNFALPMLIQVGILIVILLGLDWLLRKRVKAVIRYGIWMLILVKLLLPPSLTSPTGIGYWLGDKLPEIPSANSFEADSSHVIIPLPLAENRSELGNALDSSIPPLSPIPDKPATSVVSKSPAVPTDTESITTEQAISQAEIETSPATTETITNITWQAIVFLVWLVIVFSLALLLLQRVFFVRTLIAQSENAPGKTMDILQRCREQIKIKRNIILKLSPNTTSPSVCGLFRPVILFPRNLADRLDSQQLQSVFLHELAHIKRGDLWVSMLQTVLQIIYFYNPLLWLANWKIRRLREQAVDETVLAALGDQAEQYPNTLLDVSKQVFARPALSLQLVGVVESKAALKNRIHHIVTRPFPKSAKLGLLGFITVAIIAALLLPMAKAEKKPDGLPDNMEETKNSEFVNAPPKGATVGEKITERTLYFKLPLEQPAYHWKFIQRDAFLSGKLVFRIIRDDKINEIVIFENGKISNGWQSMRSDRGPKENAIYFGFASSAKYPTSSTDKVELVLTVTEDLDGIGRLETGVLPEGVYISKGFFWISSTSNDIAFLRWKDKWPLKITGDVGWISKKTMFVINDQGKMRSLNYDEKKRLYTSVSTLRFFGYYDVSFIEEVTVMDSSDVDRRKDSGKRFSKIRVRKGTTEQRVDIVAFVNENKTETRSESTLFGGPPLLDKPFLRLDHTRKKVFVEQSDWSLDQIRKKGFVEQSDWSSEYDILQFGRVNQTIATNIGVLCHSSDYAKMTKHKEHTAAFFNDAAGTDEIQLINPSDGSIQYTLLLDKQDWAICHRIQWYHKQPNIVSKSVEYANFIKPVKYKILAEPGDSGYLLPHNIVRRYFDTNGNEEKNETINIVDAAMVGHENNDFYLDQLTYEKDFKVTIPENYTIIDNRSADPLTIEPDDNSRQSFMDTLSQEVKFNNPSLKPGQKTDVQVKVEGLAKKELDTSNVNSTDNHIIKFVDTNNLKDKFVPHGVLCGLIMDAQTGEPIKDTEITIYSYEHGERHRTKSDKKGFYSFATLKKKGEYRISIEALNHIGIDTRDRQFIQLDPSSKKIKHFSLSRGCTVQVKATDEQGNPVKNVRLYAALMKGDWWKNKAESKTDTDGNAILGGIEPSDVPYMILARHPDYARIGQKVILAKPHDSKSMEFMLKKGLEIKGKAICSDGNPAGGWKINIAPLWWKNGYSYPEHIDENGEFSIPHVIPGVNKISINIPQEGGGSKGLWSTELTLPLLNETLVLNIPHPSSKNRVSISGRLKFVGGESGRGVWVRARSKSGDSGSVYVPKGQEDFKIINLVPGIYNIDCDVMAGDAEKRVFRNIKAPSEGNILELKIKQTGNLHGRVVNKKTGDPVKEYRIRELGKRSWKNILGIAPK